MKLLFVLFPSRGSDTRPGKGFDECVILSQATMIGCDTVLPVLLYLQLAKDKHVNLTTH